jgi:hypothetical protein
VDKPAVWNNLGAKYYTLHFTLRIWSRIVVILDRHKMVRGSGFSSTVWFNCNPFEQWSNFG